MENETPLRGRISDMGVLNLLSAKSPEEFDAIERIEDVGVILVPRALAMALARIPMEDVGTIVPMAEDEDLVVISGQTTMTGEALAAGDPERSLLIVGQVFVTTLIERVGYKAVHVVGQMFAPRGSEAALAPVLRTMTGQTLYIPTGGRLIFETESYGREFLDALPHPTPLIVFGTVTFEPDVDIETLRRVVPEIVLFGTVLAPKRLLPTIQALAPVKYGTLTAKED